MLQRLLRAKAMEAGIEDARNGNLLSLAMRLNPKIINKTQAYSWLANEAKVTPLGTMKAVTKTAAARYILSDEFYASDEWQRLRFKALQASDGCCCLCGRNRREHGVVLHVDHIKPRSKYPELQLNINNLHILSADCNLGKSNTDETDYRPENHPHRLRPDDNVIRLDRMDWKQW